MVGVGELDLVVVLEVLVVVLIGVEIGPAVFSYILIRLVAPQACVMRPPQGKLQSPLGASVVAEEISLPK
jgi:hypothetical protein